MIKFTYNNKEEVVIEANKDMHKFRVNERSLKGDKIDKQLQEYCSKQNTEFLHS